MYVILVYDFGERRVAKMLKLCRKYLNWIQNSVFEGEISEVRLKEIKIYSEEEREKLGNIRSTIKGNVICCKGFHEGR